MPRSAWFFSIFFVCGRFLPADTITDVTVDGSVAGTGSMMVRCMPSETGCTPVFSGAPFGHQTLDFSFNGTNTQLGSFSDSGLVTSPEGTTLLGRVVQSTAATADGFSLFMNSGFQLYPVTQVVYSYDVNLTNNISVGFDLSTASMLGFQWQIFIQAAVQLMDSNGDTVFSTAFRGSGATSVVLQPGAYTFTESLPFAAQNSFPPPIGVTGNFYLSSIDAAFTPIPEPRLGWVILISLGICCIARRWQLSRLEG
jgi:hypothetical protein